jgi:hypothetical protein
LVGPSSEASSAARRCAIASISVGRSGGGERRRRRGLTQTSKLLVLPLGTSLKSIRSAVLGGAAAAARRGTCVAEHADLSLEQLVDALHLTRTLVGTVTEQTKGVVERRLDLAARRGATLAARRRRQ